MADHIYDLIIIGAGPAGYTAALRAASMGMDAVLIEKKALGGSCVNTGCIPAKALLQATAVYRDMLKAFRFGIVAEKVSFDWRQMQIYKNESVESFRSMIQGMLEKAEVEMIHGGACDDLQRRIDAERKKCDSGNRFQPCDSGYPGN